jgi:RNA-directed DNA polymerase
MDTNVSIPVLFMLTGRNASGAEGSLWHFINWGEVIRSVKSLQIRIAKAVKSQQWRKVRSLQWILTHNFAAKLLAVKRVTENTGKRTAGIDGKTWKTAAEKQQAAHELRFKGYRPKAVRRIYIPKSNGKKRPLGIPTMHDRAMQALHLLGLDPVSETTGDANSYGFRPNRSCADAIARAFSLLCKRNSPEWVLEGDIQGCFDNISHEWMLKNIPIHSKTLQQWLQAGFVETQHWFPTTRGTPQGSIVSPTLANMVLDGLESHLDKICEIKNRSTVFRGYNPYRIHLIRYADDFIVTSSDPQYLENVVRPAIETFLNERGLTLSQEKTQITSIEQGFNFLGQNIRKYKKTEKKILLIQPSEKNVKSFLAKVKQTIQSNSNVRTGFLIQKLNPMIRGWALYHRHIVAKQKFVDIDHAVTMMLWKWAKRRHKGRKSIRWVKNRYFTRHKGFDWTLFDINDETKETLCLFRAASIRIQRHVKIDSKANPYSPKDEPYFERRTDERMAAKLEGRNLLSYLYHRQKKCCPVCEQRITLLSGWNTHHIVAKHLGGKNTRDNLVLLHPNCHKSVHQNPSLWNKIIAAQPIQQSG